MPKRCISSGCETLPSYGTVWKKPLYCLTHKLDGMKDVKHKTCTHDGCKTRPTYGTEWKKPLYCLTHKLDGMKDVWNKTCTHDGCETRPTYGTEWRKPLYCLIHKLDGMKDVWNKTCSHDGCETRPTYGTEWRKPLYCLIHKLDGMKDVVNNTCSHDGCKTQPSYGTEWMKPLYCSTHKLDGMKNVKNKTCTHDGCETRPTFGNEWGKALYCDKHKEDGMFNVKDKRCSHDGCEIIPKYGIPGHQPEYCATHKQPNTILRPTKRCSTKNCKNIALYGVSTAIKCEDRRGTNPIDFVQRSCTSCGLPYILDKNGKCNACDPNVFNTFRLAKQRRVKQHLDATDIDGYKYTLYDRIIDDGVCGMERPDFLFEAWSHYVVLEVDENQHKVRQELRECTKMVNVSQGLGMPTVFIRYNPDTYYVFSEGGRRKVDPAHSRRMKALDLRLKTVLSTVPISYCSATYLFYDGYDETKPDYRVITSYE
uniref:Uncharacterized protein n=1 Tax=viral metagenome TaxID=1070528 RepID=A0A6C0M1K6_9ZZZZ